MLYQGVLPGPVTQSVVSPITDPGGREFDPGPEIDHEIISTVILLLGLLIQEG